MISDLPLYVLYFDLHLEGDGHQYDLAEVSASANQVRDSLPIGSTFVLQLFDSSNVGVKQTYARYLLTFTANDAEVELLGHFLVMSCEPHY